ncbi:unnamed protein product [Tenebrio molitor]|nr:unnamed protein product [Tenebrio molitor]
MAVSATVATYHHHEDNGPASYKFEYGVEDPHTGDKKSQFEHRHGKEVTGSYSLKEADGTTRVVKYHAGPHSGFNAVVERIGHAQHPAHYGHVGHGGFGGQGGHGGHGGSSYVGVTHYGYGH